MDIQKYLEIMRDKVGRSTLFGIPLQHRARLPVIAERAAGAARPMITGFNPADMYAVDHIRRVLELFPGGLQRHR